MKTFFLSLSLLLAQLIAQAQSGPWNLAGGQAQTTSPFALGLGTLAPQADFHLYKDYSSSAPAVPAPLMRVNVYNGFATASLFELISDGKLGLGTSSPAQRLHVQGNVFISNRLGINVAQPMEKFHLEGGNMLLENGSLILSNGTFKVSSATSTYLAINDVGNVGIGIEQADAKLHVKDGDIRLTNGSLYLDYNGLNNFKITAGGFIRARQVVVDLAAIPDYVFSPDYCLMNLNDLEKYLQTYHHLPNIPSAAEFANTGGIDLGDLQLRTLEKLEEVFLYLLQLKKENEALKEQMQVYLNEK